jgi:secernin
VEYPPGWNLAEDCGKDYIMRRIKFFYTVAWLLLFAIAVPRGLLACDTFVAMPDATKDGIMILGKNSDRPTFDCQPLVYYPRREWPQGSEIDLGRLALPQVAETYATLGSSPYWCWGYEEGVNEHGVAIGNEGVFTKPLVEGLLASERGEGPKPGPTGMDLIRLALERSRTAREARDVITGLVEAFGQFGSGSPTQGVAAAYDNSFIIADPNEAWILETAGRRWVARKLDSGVASISNKLGIAAAWNLASDDLVEHAAEKGWWQGETNEGFDFSVVYSADIGPAEERLERARVRQERSCALLEEKTGEVDIAWMKRIARDRASEPGIDLDETASSCVASLPDHEKGLPVFWWCAARPSNSCYVPFFVHGSRLPEIVTRAGTHGKRVVAPSKAEADAFSPDSYWWLFRDLTDMVSADWDKRHPMVRAEFDRLEAAFETGLEDVLNEARSLKRAGDDDAAVTVLDRYTASCVEQVLTKVNEFREQFESETIEIPAMYQPYVGTYIGNFAAFQDAEFEVRVQNNRLAVDVPSQMVFEMKDPDDAGRWYFALTDLIAVSFLDDGLGGTTAMRFHQTTQIPRKAGDVKAPTEGLPEAYRPYAGEYMIAPGMGVVTVLVAGGRLALDIPNQATIELEEPDADGRWYFADDATTAVSFDRDETGNVERLNLHRTFELPRAQ